VTTGPHHELVIHIDRDGDVSVTIHCPHTGADRPCASWRDNAEGESCICTCEACVDGAHGDCESDYIEDIGSKWCDARPLDECWFQHAIATVDWRDMLDFGHEGVQARIPVKLHGNSWEEPIEVEAIAQPEVTR
jgi:hypothetical protein